MSGTVERGFGNYIQCQLISHRTTRRLMLEYRTPINVVSNKYLYLVHSSMTARLLMLIGTPDNVN